MMLEVRIMVTILGRGVTKRAGVGFWNILLLFFLLSYKKNHGGVYIGVFTL